MARKSNIFAENLKKAKQQLEEAEKLAQEARLEEENTLKEAEDSINSILDANEMFCGVILQKQDVVSILQIALETNEKIKIPFKLYFKN